MVRPMQSFFYFLQRPVPTNLSMLDMAPVCPGNRSPHHRAGAMKRPPPRHAERRHELEYLDLLAGGSEIHIPGPLANRAPDRPLNDSGRHHAGHRNDRQRYHAVADADRMLRGDVRADHSRRSADLSLAAPAYRTRCGGTTRRPGLDSLRRRGRRPTCVCLSSIMRPVPSVLAAFSRASAAVPPRSASARPAEPWLRRR